MNTAVDILTEKKLQLSKELEALQERSKEIRASIRSIEEAIVALSSDGATRSISSMSLKELVLEALKEQDEGLTPGEIAESLTNAGRSTSSQSVSSTLSRLKGEGKVDSHPSRHGVWVFKKPPPLPPWRKGDELEGLGDGSRDRLSTESPEGSIPSSSTSTRPPWEDDDENPFG